MKVIGIIGGISPASTAYYYEVLNDLARERLGDRHSARCLIHSVDFAGVEAMHRARDWSGVTQVLVEASLSLQQGGAACVMIACNTMHHVAGPVAAAIDLPFLHIGDETAVAIEGAGAERVLLLGTRFTMEAAFIKSRIEARGIDVVVPDKAGRDAVHAMIYDELCAGEIRTESRNVMLEVIERALVVDAIDGVVFGCTELGLLVGPQDVVRPLFDTARIHARAAIDFALS